jgi:hypothetical protein
VAYLIVLSIFFLCATSMAYSSTIPSGYAYCKTHQIIGSPDGGLTDYQIKIVAHNGPGTDTGQDVFLNGSSQSWPYDIRFTDPANSPYPFWIESYDADTATIWVKIDSIPAYPGTKTVNLYYGRSDDQGASDGSGTFLAFDDFHTNRIGTYWDETYSADGAWAWTTTHTVENGGYHLVVPKAADSAGFLQLRDALASPSVSVVTLSYDNLKGRSPPWVYFSVDDGGAQDRYYAFTFGYWGNNIGGFDPESPSDNIRIEWTDGSTKDNVRIYRGNTVEATGSANFSTYKKPSFGLRTASAEKITASFTKFYAYKYTANPPVQSAWASAPAESTPPVSTAPVSTTPVPTTSGINLSTIDIAIAILLALAFAAVVLLGILVFRYK